MSVQQYNQLKPNNMATHLQFLNNQSIILNSQADSTYPKQTGSVFKKITVAIDPNLLTNNQVIVKNLYLSVDASMRPLISGVTTYTDPLKIGDLMKGRGIAEIVESKSSQFKKGDRVYGLTHWQNYSVLSATGLTKVPQDHVTPYDFLGVLGASGLTAYFGLTQIGKVKKGDIVVISGAAGGVGELAVQIAKILGATVCGIVGSDQKCEYIRSLGADFAINYKRQNLKSKLREYCPKGLDVYFDNVGGAILDEALMHIKEGSRIVACGSISTYDSLNNTNSDSYYRIKNYPRITIKMATIKGFIYYDFAAQFPSAIKQLTQWIKQNKLRERYDLQKGLDNAEQGLKRLLSGVNMGKVIVQVNVPCAKL